MSEWKDPTKEKPERNKLYLVKLKEYHDDTNIAIAECLSTGTWIQDTRFVEACGGWEGATLDHASLQVIGYREIREE